MNRYRIEIAVISEEMSFEESSKLRAKLEEVMRTTKGVKEGLSSSVEIRG